MAVGRVDPRPAGLDRLGRRAVDGAEPRAVMPIQQRGGGRNQLRADVVEDLARPGAGRAPRFRRAESSGASSARANRPHVPAVGACRPRNTAFSGGLSPSLAALPSTTRPPEISTWLRRSTRSSRASGQPATAASMSVRSVSARSAPTRDSSGTLRSRERRRPIAHRSAFRAADVQQPVAELQGVDLAGRRRAAASPLRTTPSTMSVQVPRRAADLLRARPRVRRCANPASGVSRSSIISTTLGVCVAMPSSRPAVSEVTTVESAPDCSQQVLVLGFPDRGDDLGVGRELAGGQRDEHGGCRRGWWRR